VEPDSLAGGEPLSTEQLLDSIQRLNADDRSMRSIATWQNHLSELLGGAFVALSELRGQPPELSRELTSPIEPALAEIWSKHCPDGLPWFNVLAERSGTFVDVAKDAPSCAGTGGALEREFCDPLGLDPRAVLGAFRLAIDSGDQPEQAALWTLIGRRPFRPDEIEFCRRLYPHISLAMKRRGDYHFFRHRMSFAEEAFMNSRTGMALLTEDTRVLWANRVAERMFEERNGIALEDGALVGLRSAETQQIKSRVAAWRDRVGEEVIERGLLPIERPGRSPLGLYFRPSPPMVAASTDAVTLCAFLDPEMIPIPSRKLVQKLFNLTEAESRLAVAIASGEAPKQLAERTGRSLETVRTQLKFVFRKLGVRRQIDLVRILTKESFSRNILPGMNGDD